ncbi:MAG TPA: GvpL/GvpF family gas vesicle protein [Gaiellaceae bacterium]
MTSRRLADELRAAFASRGAGEVEPLIEQAAAEARAALVAQLKDLMVEDLLERARQALAPAKAAAGEPRLSLVGVVRADLSLEARGVELVQVGSLAAIVAKLRQDETEDPSVLEGRLRAHNDALLAALEEGAVVPARFGTLFAGPAEVAGWLERNEGTLLEELDRLGGCVEWTFAVSERPVPVEEPETVAAGPAATYLERRLAEGEFAAQRRRELAEKVGGWHECLARGAEEAVLLASDALLDGAYLVRRADQAVFDAALLEVQSELDEFELESRLTGPWPPFNFVSAELR